MKDAPERLPGFTEVYGAYSRDIWRYALSLSGDRAWADDLTAEAFLRVWEAGPRVQLVTVKAYLVAIVRNLYLKDLDKRRRMVEMPERAQAASTAGPELEEILQLLQQMPEDDRSALLMRAEQGLSYAEIGALLGISEGAARVKVHRARTRLVEMRDGHGTSN